MTDEKPKRKIGDDPNPHLPPPPLSRARLAAKIEKVFEESLPMSAPRRVLPIKPAKPSAPMARSSTVERLPVKQKVAGSSPASPAKLRGRPPGKKPPKTLAERQKAFRDRKREGKP